MSNLYQNELYDINMKAKLIINEIKQNKEESGLGSIGVGKHALTRTYDHIKNSNYPSILKYAEDLNNTSLPQKIKNRVCEILETSHENIIGISDSRLQYINIKGISTSFVNWLNHIDTNGECIIYEQHIIDDNRYIVKTPYYAIWDIIRVRTFSNDKIMPYEILEECYVFFRK